MIISVSKIRITALLSFLLTFLDAGACQCPPTSMSSEETNKYEIIFKGVVTEVRPCGDRPGEAVFKVDELYKGNAEEKVTVQFECSGDCAVGFREGEEWIIYSRYRQVNVARMDWCSRSRKYFRHENEDFYKVNFGSDYQDEVAFLRKTLGPHRLLKSKEDFSAGRNRLPGLAQSAWLIIASLAGIVLFYVLFKRFLR